MPWGHGWGMGPIPRSTVTIQGVHGWDLLPYVSKNIRDILQCVAYCSNASVQCAKVNLYRTATHMPAGGVADTGQNLVIVWHYLSANFFYERLRFSKQM